MHIRTVVGAVAALLLAAPVAGAQNLVTNGSFETNLDPWVDPAAYTAALNGWTSTQGACVTPTVAARMVPPGSGYTTAEDGSWFAFFSFVSCRADLSQSFTGTAGQSYLFSAFVHNAADQTPGPGGLGVTIDEDPTFSIDHDATNDNAWTQVTGSFTATGAPETLRLAGSWSYLDNVQIVASSAPEPSSLALLGTGLFGLIPMLRRRRR